MGMEKDLLLISLQVGMPRTVGEPGARNPMDREWTSAIFKTPVDGPIWLGRLNLHGDAQADLTVHGGVDKAVLAYSAQHYPLWRKELRLDDLPYGAFGENFTIQGLDEHNVSIGDSFEVGEAVVQVSQPRQPCWKLASRWRIRSLPDRVLENGRSGWYFRVLKEGHVSAGESLMLLDRPCSEWSVALVTQILYNMEERKPDAERLSRCPLLAEGLRTYLAAHGRTGSIATGSNK